MSLISFCSKQILPSLDQTGERKTRSRIRQSSLSISFWKDRQVIEPLEVEEKQRKARMMSRTKHNYAAVHALVNTPPLATTADSKKVTSKAPQLTNDTLDNWFSPQDQTGTPASEENKDDIDDKEKEPEEPEEPEPPINTVEKDVVTSAGISKDDKSSHSRTGSNSGSASGDPSITGKISLPSDSPRRTTSPNVYPSVSPLADDITYNQLWDSFQKAQSITSATVRASAVSPLSSDRSQSFLPLRATSPDECDSPTSTKKPNSLANASISSNDSSQLKTFLNLNSPTSPSGLKSSSSSVCSRVETATLAPTEVNVDDYLSLFDPVDADVFEDDNESCMSRRTYSTYSTKSQIRQTLLESRMKALPPPPEGMEHSESPILPAFFLQQRLSQGSRKYRSLKSPDSGKQHVSLPPSSKPRDIDTLDDALRQSGTYFRGKKLDRSPSLLEATRDLEEHLASMTSPTESCPPSFHTQISHKRSEKHMDRRTISGAYPISSHPRYHRASSISSSKHNFKLQRSGSILSASSRMTRASSISSQRSTHEVPLGFEDLSTPLLRPDRFCASADRTEDDSSVAVTPLSPRTQEQNLRNQLPPLQTNNLLSSTNGLGLGLSVVLESPGEQAEAGCNTYESTSTMVMTGLGRLDSNRSSRDRDSHGTLDSDNGLPMVNPSIDTNSDIPMDVAQYIILRIIQSVDHLDDLFNIAVIDRAFYNIFKRHELSLIKNTLYRMSPPAWELREMSPAIDDDEYTVTYMPNEPVTEYTPGLYVRLYTRDLCTMAALKSLILMHCEGFLRIETARALAGLDSQRSAEIDDAFWRVWTFCRIFGCGKDRENEVDAQVDWLTGGLHPSGLEIARTKTGFLPDSLDAFGQGNAGGLNSAQLCDMMEIWTCLAVLLQVFHGRCDQARKYGVFDNKKIRSGDIEREEILIEEWTRYLLTLGPAAILTLLSLDPSSPVDDLFARAQALGWTNWTRSKKTKNGSTPQFLRDAISRVCRNQNERATSRATPRSPEPLNIDRSSSPAYSSSQESISSKTSADSRRRQAEFAAELRNQREQRKTRDSSASGSERTVHSPHSIFDERPISNFEAVITKLDSRSTVRPSVSLSSLQSSPVIEEPDDDHFSSTLYIPPPGVPMPPVMIPSPAPSLSTSPSPPQSSSASVPSSRPVTRRHSSVFSEEKISRGRHPNLPPTPPHTDHDIQHKILDPADLAIQKMVHELGFNEVDAKWALKCTDTGESLDVEAAVHLLMETKNAKRKQWAVNAYLTSKKNHKQSSVPQTHSDLIYRPTWRWA
ncbi:hypothetical protein FQN57_002374 [Myotisia sp. PD_48]|nr:hypothetical protein FQN57_002374 [Myotisia sp. PD_48]